MERFLGDLVLAQRNSRHDATVLAHRDRGTSYPDDPPWLMRCPVWLRLVFAPISPAYPFWLWRAIRRWKPEVIHFHLPNVSAFWALLLPSARRLPWVIHWHSDVERSRIRRALRLLYPYYRLVEQALLDRADAIVVTSPQYLAASEPLARWREKCHVVPLGLAMERLPDLPSSAGAEYWSSAAKSRLLAIGRLTYYKGFATLIRAMSALPDAQLIIVGEGEERQNLERELANEGNPGNVRLLGAADDATCNRLLASCNIFCLSSCERTEAFGIVLLEAMRYGKPMVASRLPGSGVTWVVEDGVNGMLVPVDDVSAWSDALRYLSTASQLRETMGNNGSRRLHRTFDIADVSRRIDQIYQQALSVRADIDRPLAMRTVRMPVLAVIPALDEAETIGEVVSAVIAGGLIDVLVVDDGSRDDTAKLAAEAGAMVLRVTLAPQGAWGAIQTGIRYAISNGYAGVVTMDADGQHEPGYIAQLIEVGRSVDVVIGAYPERGSSVRRIAWAWFRRLTGFELADLTSGFRYYNQKACELLAGQEATLLDYQDIGVLLLLRHAGLSIAEMPVVMGRRRTGGSKIFSSWWAVGTYMLETTLLCMARWGIKSKAK